MGLYTLLGGWRLRSTASAEQVSEALPQCSAWQGVSSNPIPTAEAYTVWGVNRVVFVVWNQCAACFHCLFRLVIPTKLNTFSY